MSSLLSCLYPIATDFLTLGPNCFCASFRRIQNAFNHNITYNFFSCLFTLLPNFAGCCAYLDPENAMNPSLAETMGVNTNNLLISRVDCAEKTLSILNTLVSSGFVDVIVVDSVRNYCFTDISLSIYIEEIFFHILLCNNS